MLPVTARQVALLGASGQLGKTLQARWSASQGNDKIALHSFSHDQLDICKAVALQTQLGGLDIDVVINAAAYTQVDRAETDNEQAYKINAEATRNVARWATVRGCQLLHISTDFVFGGTASKPYIPEAKTAPLNVYGASKLAGEKFIQDQRSINAIILRTSWLYSPYQSNFVLTMLRLMAERDRLGVVDDQIGSPTSTSSLADLIEKVVLGPAQSGIFHWSDKGEISWYDFAAAIQQEALAIGLLQRKIPVFPISTEQYPTAAKRPAYSVLDTAKAQKVFGIQPTPWREALRDVIQEIKLHKETST